MLRNYIFNGEFQLLMELTPIVQMDYAERGIRVKRKPHRLNTPQHCYPEQSMGVPHDPSDMFLPAGVIVHPTVTHPDECVEQHGIEQPSRHGLCPGWGGGPGVGGRMTVKFMDRSFAETRFPGNPERYLWRSLDLPPNPVPLSQASGWEPGQINPDGTPRHAPGSSNPWRVTILEHGIRDCEELPGSWLGYSFFAMTGGPSFPMLPLFWSGYQANNFFLHDLQHVIDVGAAEPVEVCGWFYLPPVPIDPCPAVRGQFYVGFGIDTTMAAVPDVLLTGFKVVRWPDASKPRPPASEIKYLVEKETYSALRQRSKNWYLES